MKSIYFLSAIFVVFALGSAEGKATSIAETHIYFKLLKKQLARETQAGVNLSSTSTRITSESFCGAEGKSYVTDLYIKSTDGSPEIYKTYVISETDLNSAHPILRDTCVSPVFLSASEAVTVLGILKTELGDGKNIFVMPMSCSQDVESIRQGQLPEDATLCNGKGDIKNLNLKGKAALDMFNILLKSLKLNTQKTSTSVKIDISSLGCTPDLCSITP